MAERRVEEMLAQAAQLRDVIRRAPPVPDPPVPDPPPPFPVEPPLDAGLAYPCGW